MFKSVQGLVRVLRVERRSSFVGNMYQCGDRGYIPLKLAHAIKGSQSSHPVVG